MAVINTNGGAFIGGRINAKNVYLRDKIVFGDEINHGDPQASNIPLSQAPVDVDMTGLPEGAILNASFVGGRMTVGATTYRLMQPVTKRGGMFVYVPSV